MKVCILGNGLTSFTLAKALINQGIEVDICSNVKLKNYSKFQTLGITKSNIDFFNKNILNIEKIGWKIHDIEIFSENLLNEKILNFNNRNEHLFSVIRNFDLYNSLYLNLKKNKLIHFKKDSNYKDLIQKYNLVFNCENKNIISKKFFSKRIDKKYESYAHVTTILHKKISANNTASQIFTKDGPIAFLPISPSETSIVYSRKGGKHINFIELIKKYNSKFKILKINDVFSFELFSSNLRNYHHQNIIAFGDSLHRLHPLAGQGFNMIVRDIEVVVDLIKFKKEHGLDLDNSICLNFEKKTRSKNYLFSFGVDAIYEFFNFESKIKNKSFAKTIKYFGKNKFLNKIFTKFADKGIIY